MDMQPEYQPPVQNTGATPVEHKVHKEAHLLVHSVEPSSFERDVLIIGNAYGVMPYQAPLADFLASRGQRCWWFAFSGQDDTPGHYSVSSCTRDIQIATDLVKSKASSGSLHVVAHCAGSLMTTEFLLNTHERPFDSMIVYGLLFRPHRRRADAVKRMLETGVRQKIEEEAWGYPWLRKLPQLDVPVLFCHSRDLINRLRAREREVKAAAAATNISQLKWFEKGYDEDLSSLIQFGEVYLSWFANSSLLGGAHDEMDD